MNLLSKIIISVKYLDYANVFLFKFATKLLKHNNTDYMIKLKDNK